MKIRVDLNRCQGYGQCCFASPQVFQLQGTEALEYDPTPDDELREQVERAARACPVQAIILSWQDQQREHQRASV